MGVTMYFAHILLLFLPLGHCIEFVYTIETTWNGSPVSHYPPHLMLSSTESGNLVIKIEARLVGDLPFPPNCSPGRPYPGLWNYEVVEAFFLDPVQVSYVELEFSPCGAHLALLLHPQRVALVSYLPLDYKIEVVGDTCLGVAEIPAEYLPANVSSWNAFAIHKAMDSEYDQAWEDGKAYEALFPVRVRGNNLGRARCAGVHYTLSYLAEGAGGEEV